MGEVAPFRLFKIPRSDGSFIVQKSLENKPFCVKDLAKSGLTPEDMGACYDDDLQLSPGATAGYLIPYCDLNGRPLIDSVQEIGFYRIRLQFPEYVEGPRYKQPASESLIARGMPSYIPYIHPASFQFPAETMICAEGEKKTASIIKFLRLAAFGIGGCHMWRDPVHDRQIHPWILRLLEQRGTKRVIIVPDGDILRYDICAAYSGMVHALGEHGYEVQILHPKDKIDDLLVKEGPAVWESIPKLAPSCLIQNPATLAEKYGLAFKTNADGMKVVHQHTSNIMMLMRLHPAFPRVWKDEDRGAIMVGDVPAQPNGTEMQLANYCQHNLSLDKVTHDKVRACIMALALEHKRSPFLERIKGIQWDHKLRLDTWMSRLWGVEDTPFSRQVSAKWLMASCARLHVPGTKIDYMLVTQGGQGIGKSSMPDVLFHGNALILYGEQEDKDLHMLLHSSLVVGFDEMDSFGKKEVTTLRAMITRPSDSFRPPYGASVETFPRRFVLYGSCNSSIFLQHDPDGQRRYAVIHVPRKLDFQGLKDERDQLWAEAWYRYKNETINYWEIEGATEVARKYEVLNPLDDQIISWLQGQARSSQIERTPEGHLEFTLPQLMIGMNYEKELRNMHFVRNIQNILNKMGAVVHDRTRTKPRRFTINPGNV